MLAKMTWNPSERQLRQFGLCALVALPLVGWFTLGRTAPALWTGGQTLLFGVFALLGLAGGVLGWLQPKALRLPFVALTLVTLPIGMVVGEMVLLIVYFGLFTPIAFLFHLMGRDALKLRFEPAAASYWTPKARATSVQQYFRQS